MVEIRQIDNGFIVSLDGDEVFLSSEEKLVELVELLAGVKTKSQLKHLKEEQIKIVSKHLFSTKKKRGKK